LCHGKWVSRIAKRVYKKRREVEFASRLIREISSRNENDSSRMRRACLRQYVHFQASTCSVGKRLVCKKPNWGICDLKVIWEKSRLAQTRVNRFPQISLTFTQTMCRTERSLAQVAISDDSDRSLRTSVSSVEVESASFLGCSSSQSV